MRTLSLLGMVGVILFAPAAQGANYSLVAMTPTGALVFDRTYNHWRHGYRITAEVIVLPEPTPFAGLMMQRIDIFEEWDCIGWRHRIVRRNYRTLDGRYLYTSAAVSPWAGAPPSHDEAIAAGLACSPDPEPVTEVFRDLETLQRVYFERLSAGRLAGRSSNLIEAAAAP